MVLDLRGGFRYGWPINPPLGDRTMARDEYDHLRESADHDVHRDNEGYTTPGLYGVALDLVATLHAQLLRDHYDDGMHRGICAGCDLARRARIDRDNLARLNAINEAARIDAH